MSAENKPMFNMNQIITKGDLQQKWGSIETKLKELPYLVVFSDNIPKAVLLDYQKFEEIWNCLQELSGLKFQLELMSCIINNIAGDKPKIALAKIISKTDISLDNPDIQLET